MTHEEIEQREIVDAYVRGSLSDAERQIFEEHFFGCDRCFSEVQTAQRFSDAVNEAVRTGTLPKFQAPSSSEAANWFRPAFGLSAAAAVLLAAVAIWLGLFALPQARESARLEKQQANDLAVELSRQQIARVPPSPQVAMAGNLPLVMLEASRATSADTLTIPAGATQAAVWMDAVGAYRTYRLVIPTKPPITVDALVKNPYGALAAIVPTDRLAVGKYRVQLYGINGGRETLAQEYTLEVRR